MNIEELGAEFEAQNPTAAEGKKDLVCVKENNAVTERAEKNQISANTVVGDTQQKILSLAQNKIQSDKIIKKHARKIAEITDKAIKVDAEKTALNVEKQDAANKVEKQEIKNKLIVLKAEAKRLRKEQAQLNREQKADHKARRKKQKWDLYSGKLTKMGYSYVPNVFILSMLLFFDGVKSFFDGVGKVSTSFVVAMKWVLLIGAILIVLFSIPVTREWITNLLKGG